MKAFDVEFHNVAELRERPAAGGGRQLLRVPHEVGRQMSSRGRWNSQQTGGVELRFVTDAPHFRLFLSSLEGDAEVLVFRGEQLVSSDWLDPGRQLCLHVYAPEKAALVAESELGRGSRFGPGVWRILLAGYQAVFHELESFGWEVRAPRVDELPGKRWLNYGSSITAGSGSSRTDLSYGQLAARRLGLDVLNMGFGGACHAEGALADFFAEGLEWDLATLELGVNMRGSFEPEIFAQRAGYLIDRLLKAPPARPVILITPFITGEEHQLPVPASIHRQRAYEAWLRKRVASDDTGRLHLIEGHSLLSEVHALNADQVHPGPYGHMLIAERLADCLQAILTTPQLPAECHR